MAHVDEHADSQQPTTASEGPADASAGGRVQGASGLLGQHQILPWTVRDDPHSALYGVFDANGFIVIDGLLLAEAEFVVRAVNHFDQMLEALKELHATSEGFVNLKQFAGADVRFAATRRVRNAIAVARGLVAKAEGQ